MQTINTSPLKRSRLYQPHCTYHSCGSGCGRIGTPTQTLPSHRLMYVHIHETIFASGVVHINIKFYHRLFIGIEATSPSIVFLIRVSIQTSYFICPKQLNNNFTSNRMKIRTPLSLHRHSRMQLLCVDATDCISSLGSPGWNKHKK